MNEFLDENAPLELYVTVYCENQGSKFAMRIRTIAKNCEAKRIRFAQNGLDFASLSLRNFSTAFAFAIFLDCEFAICSHNEMLINDQNK